MAIKARLLPILLGFSPLVFGAISYYWWSTYNTSLEENATTIQREVESKADLATEVVNQYVEEIRTQVIDAGEAILANIPLPFSEMPVLEFRALDTAIARASLSWGDIFVVSLDPSTRQFYYENRRFRSDAVFLVSLGQGVGPIAEIRDNGYEFVLAEPMSQKDWVALARVSPDKLRSRLIDAIGADGYLEMDQGGGAVDRLYLFKLGAAPQNPTITRKPIVESWVIRYQPSTAFLAPFGRDSSGFLLNAYIFAGLTALTTLLVLLLVLRAYSLSMRNKAELASAEAAHKKAFNPSSTQTWTSDIAGAKTAPTNPNKNKNDDIEKYLAKEVEATAVDEEETEPFMPLRARDLPEKIFRANDIRGIVDSEITTRFARHLGRAFASLTTQKVYMCRDGRLSSRELSHGLRQGLLESGRDVVNLGVGPTPLLSQYLATHLIDKTGIMVTGSHNAKEYNGFKITLGGKPFSGTQIAELRELMLTQEFETGRGKYQKIDHNPAYQKALLADIGDLRGMRIVVDGANGSAGPLCSQAFGLLGCDVRELYCDIDGDFPNHAPDPCQSANLTKLCETVVNTGAHFGIALDGDGDRMVAVDELGTIVTPDQLFQLFTREILLKTPGAGIVFDVKASRRVASTISRWGGIPLLEKSGRTFIQNRVKQSGALFGGEYSSHYFFADQWNAIDDGIYAAARLAEIVRLYNVPLSTLLADFPPLPATEELEIEVGDDEKFAIFETLRQSAEFQGAMRVEIDGLRVEFPAAWGLVRVSNTGPKLSIRFEGETDQALVEIQTLFHHEFERLLPDLNLPF